MDPITIAIIGGAAYLATRKPVAAPPPPEPEPPSTKGITSALEVAGAAIIIGGVVAGIDAIGDALEKKELTFDWKHEIRDVLLSGDADHLYVTNPDAEKGTWVLRSTSRDNLRLAYNFAITIYPKPSGVHSPFAFSDAWGWYTDYYMRRRAGLEAEIKEAKAALSAASIQRAAEVATAEAVTIEEQKMAAAQTQLAAQLAWFRGLAS